MQIVEPQFDETVISGQGREGVIYFGDLEGKRVVIKALKNQKDFQNGPNINLDEYIELFKAIQKSGVNTNIPEIFGVTSKGYVVRELVDGPTLESFQYTKQASGDMSGFLKYEFLNRSLFECLLGLLIGVYRLNDTHTFRLRGLSLDDLVLEKSTKRIICIDPSIVNLDRLDKLTQMQMQSDSYLEITLKILFTILFQTGFFNIKDIKEKLHYMEISETSYESEIQDKLYGTFDIQSVHLDTKCLGFLARLIRQLLTSDRFSLKNFTPEDILKTWNSIN